MESSIKIKIENVDCSDFRVWTADIHEAISELYSAKLRILTSVSYTMAKLKQTMLGQKTVLTLEQKHAGGIIRRYLNGVVTACSVLGAAGYQPGWEAKDSKDARCLMFTLTIEPFASKMRSSGRTQDYTNTTPLKVIADVFRRNGVDAVQDAAYINQEKYTGFFRFFQHNETDFDFVMRVMAKYGISFTFRHSPEGPEQLYLSDGEAFPALTDFEFSNYPSPLQDQLTKSANNERYDFHMGGLKADSADFPMTRFEAASAVGTDQIKITALHPLKSSAETNQKGDSASGRVLNYDNIESSFGLNVDDETLNNGFTRVLDATAAQRQLEKDSWNGETPILLAVPGKVAVLHNFYTTSKDDPAIISRVLSSDLQCTPGSNKEKAFSVRFRAMDFSDELTEKRFCPPLPKAKTSAPVIQEAVVCDINGDIDNEMTVNHICPSPHSTPETPWLFMVRNTNPDTDQKCIDVVMTMPLGGNRSGLYRFPRVGDRVLVMETENQVTLLGYSPDRDTAFSEFAASADSFGRNAFSMRTTTLNENGQSDGRHNEIGFTFTDSAEKYMEQHIVDGTAYTLLIEKAVAENDQKMRSEIELIWQPRLIQTRKAYFDNRNEASVTDLTMLAKEIVAEFKLAAAANRNGDVLSLYSNGSIFQYSKNGIDIITDGPLNITADEIHINGKNMLNMQSDRLLRGSVANSSLALNVSGIAIRSLKVVDTITRYDSAIFLNALDGVSVSGTNVNINGLMSACINDAMGGSLAVQNGELMGAGAIVDMATIPQEVMNDSFSKLDENSGLNKLNTVLSEWKAGSTPDGKPRSIMDHRISDSTKIKILQPLYPVAKFRGSASPLSMTTSQMNRMAVTSAVNGGQTEGGYEMIPGASPAVTVSANELLRAQAFAEMMDVYRQTVQTVTSSIMSGKSASVTIVSHDLELNVENINNLSYQCFDNSASGAGK